MRRNLVPCSALLLAALLACKQKPTDDRPEVDNVQLKKEQQRVAKGEVVGEKLRAPRIAVDAQQITINGYRAGARSDLDTAALKRTDSVYDFCKGLREHWKQLYPEKSFDGRAALSLPFDFTFFEGASLVQTVAFAGYPDGISLAVGARTQTLDITIPGPPQPDSPPEKPPKTLELCHGADWHARESNPSAAQPSTGREPWGSEVARGVDSTPWRPVTPATLATISNELCTGGCTRVSVGVEGAPPSFRDALELVSVALDAQASAHPSVAFRTCTLATAPPTAPSAASADAGAPVLRQGATSVNGALPPEVIQRIVRANFGRFRLCYENGLAKNPKLGGRVVVKFVIDATGNVSNASDGGSDLADRSVVACVVRAFSSLSFPAPEHGIVTVSYPIAFQAAD